jgi:hypothetical protein
MRILEGVGTLIQLGGLIARLCKMVSILLCSSTVLWLIDLATEYATGAFPDMTFISPSHGLICIAITEYRHSVYLRFEGHILKAFGPSYIK